MVVLDDEFRIVAMSDDYLRAVLRERSEILGLDLFEAFPARPDSPKATGPKALRASLKRVRDTLTAESLAAHRFDLQRPEREGGGFETQYWSGHIAPVTDDNGRLAHIVLRVENVTEFVALREDAGDALTSELLSRTERMQLEILRYTSELEAANARLRAADDARSGFLSRMSHELRTPLAAIMGFSELLSVADLGEPRQEWAQLILQAGRELLKLIDEVLEISRIESGRTAQWLEPIEVAPVLDEAISVTLPAAVGRGVTIHPPEVPPGSCHVFADRQRLRQILGQLLSNAVSFNRDGGDVYVRVVDEDIDRVCISVRDTGVGIDETSLSKLFVPFERLDAAAMGHAGTGLGLVRARGMVEAMGGQITVESERGTGTTFHVALRRGEPAAVSAETGHRTVRSYRAAKQVLYVEDTATNVRLVGDILLSRPSVELLPAMLGQVGLDLAHEHQPDLILLDLHLPDISGQQVLAKLQESADTRDIPVVILTADAIKRQLGDLLAGGARAYLTKPVGVSQLLATVDRYLDD